MRPYISVLVPTMRAGGLDVLLHGLAGQTFKDFELVLSDALAERRYNELTGMANALGVQGKHVLPRGNRFPVCQYCRQMNEAIVRARGEVALLVTDYTWLPPDLLAAHFLFHTSPGATGREGLMGPHRYAALTAIRSDFPAYGEQDTLRYAQDVASGRLDAAMGSIFARPFAEDARALPDDPFAVQHGARDPKLDRHAGTLDPRYLHCKNESVRIEHLVAINGFDEDLDGTHGWQDSDIADRLTHHRGIQWTLDPTIVAQIVNPRSVFPFALRERPYRANEDLWNAKKAAGYPAVNAWSIEEERRKMGQ